MCERFRPQTRQHGTNRKSNRRAAELRNQTWRLTLIEKALDQKPEAI